MREPCTARSWAVSKSSRVVTAVWSSPSASPALKRRRRVRWPSRSPWVSRRYASAAPAAWSPAPSPPTPNPSRLSPLKWARRRSRAGSRRNQSGSPSVSGMPARGQRAAQRLVALAADEDLRGPAQQRGLQERRPPAPVSSPAQNSPVDTSARATPSVPPPLPAVTVNGEEIVAGGAVEHLRVGERAGRDDAHHLAPHELLAAAGRLHLLAHRHLLALADEPGDIGVGGVMRDAGHGRRLARGQRDLQEARAQVGILGEHLVEVAQPEQQEIVRVAALQLAVLLHHGRELGAASVRHARRRAVRRS